MIVKPVARKQQSSANKCRIRINNFRPEVTIVRQAVQLHIILPTEEPICRGLIIGPELCIERRDLDVVAIQYLVRVSAGGSQRNVDRAK